jgi:hypothetical protein
MRGTRTGLQIPSYPPFEEGGLEASGDADLHAFATPDAALEEIPLRKRTRGADSCRIGGLGLCQGRHPQERRDSRPCQNGPCDNDVCPNPATPRRLSDPSEGDGVTGTGVVAIAAQEHSVLRHPVPASGVAAP